jgi:glycosyltransferase involved in cell wall biosynthesis
MPATAIPSGPLSAHPSALIGGRALRVLVAHNRYQLPGGEDAVFEAETALLRSAGCEVAKLETSNAGIDTARARISAAAAATYSIEGRGQMARAIARFQPDVVHVHNLFPRPGPAIFDACVAAGVPAIWTLHNFRLACAQATLFREGRSCQDCVGRPPFAAVIHGCYRGSRLGSASVAATIAFHRLAGTWRRKVSRFIVLTEFAQSIAIEAGVPAERIRVKPNFARDPGPVARERRGAVYVGRLSAEKGVDTLIEAWRSLGDIPLSVAGEGPERVGLEQLAPANVRFLGQLPREQVQAVVGQSQALILPSMCHDNFPLALAEAMAAGTPVVASRIAPLDRLVREGVDGALFAPGDPVDLARTVRRLFGEPTTLEALGRGARANWERAMEPEANLTQLLSIYREVCAGEG